VSSPAALRTPRLGCLVVAASALLLAGPRAPTAVARETPRADLAVLVGTAPRRLDPHAQVGPVEARVAEALFEGLLRLDADSGRPAPGLAEAWEVTPDGRRWTFHLRAGLVWSDGSALTARDVAWSFRRALAAATGAEYAHLFARMRHADAWTRSGPDEGVAAGRPAPSPEAVAAARAHFGIDQGVLAPDARTVVFEWDAYVPWFPDLLTMPISAPVHRTSVERLGERAFTPGALVSSGAFRLDPGSTPERVRLVRSASYWDAASTGCETVDLLPEEETAAAFERYARGEGDWLAISVDPAVAARRPAEGVQTPTAIAYFLRLDVRRPALRDVRVRRALARAIDRERLVTALPGRAPAAGLVPAGLGGYEPPPLAAAHDLAEARRLLAEAGFPGGAGLPVLTYLLNRDPGHLAIAEEVGRQWREGLGVRTELEPVEWAAFLERTRKGGWDVSRGGWIADYPDPGNFLGIFRTGDEGNTTGWSHAFFDRLLDLAANPIAGSRSLAGGEGPAVLSRLREPEALRSLSDPAADLSTHERRARLEAGRLRVLREAEALLLHDAPLIPLFTYVDRQLVSPRVEGFRRLLRGPDGLPRPNLMNVHPLRAIRVRPR
jgi:oligopeptide transport system substrate-binding protein